MPQNNHKGIGKDFERAFSEGIENQDWTVLNDVIMKSVDNFLDGVGDRMNDALGNSTGAIPLSQRTENFSGSSETARRQRELHAEREKVRERMRRQHEEREEQRRIKRSKVDTTALSYPYRNVGSVSSTVNKITGGIGLGVSGVVGFVKMAPFLFGSAALTFGMLFPVAVMAVFGYITFKGVRQNRNLAVAKRYVEIIGDRQYIDIKTLALSVNKSERQVLRDLKRLLREGFFPQGHLDRGQKTFILTDEVFSHYLELETYDTDNNVIDTTARSEDEQEFPTLSPEESAELSRMIREGNEYITKFRGLNNDIPGIEISAKLDRLEGLLKEIFTNIKKHPEQMSRIHELMDYYLPTAVKLVAAYKEYDSVSEPGKEILEAKKDIENTLDTINSALGKLLNKLFKDSVLDVTTDAQVLQTVLAQKGLK